MRSYTIELRKSIEVTVHADSFGDAKGVLAELGCDLDDVWSDAETGTLADSRRSRTMKLNPIQQLVAKHYCGGEFAHMKYGSVVEDYGDTLFEFLINEADDCSFISEYQRRLQTAIDQLSNLHAELEPEVLP